MSKMSKIMCQALCAKLGITPPPGVLSIKITGDFYGSRYVIHGNLVEPEVTEVADPMIVKPISLTDYFSASPVIHA